MSRLFLIVVFVGLIWEPKGYTQCNYNNTTFQSGEEVVYQIYYNWGFMWLEAAKVTFKVEPVHFNNKRAYYFESYGTTLPSYDWLYKVRDRFQSIADSVTLKPYWYNQETIEGNYWVNNTYSFNYSTNNICVTTENSKHALKEDTVLLKKCTLDLLTAIYATRNIRFSHLKVNDTIPLTVLIDNKIYPLYLRYWGREDVSNHNNRNFHCFKFSILVVEGTIFSGGEDLTIWVSDDPNLIPVRIDAKILVGSVKAMVSEIKGNRWPITSEFSVK